MISCCLTVACTELLAKYAPGPGLVSVYGKAESYTGSVASPAQDLPTLGLSAAPVLKQVRTPGTYDNLAHWKLSPSA